MEATEKNPVRVCRDPSTGPRTWIDVWVETDSTRVSRPWVADLWLTVSCCYHTVAFHGFTDTLCFRGTTARSSLVVPRWYLAGAEGMRGKITKRAVDALRPATDGAETVLWDSEQKGFGIRVQRGGTKTYILKYRVGTGRDAPLRKLTIGKHGSPWTA